MKDFVRSDDIRVENCQQGTYKESCF